MTEEKRLPEENYLDGVNAIVSVFLVNQENAATLYLIRHGKDEVPSPENNYRQPLSSQGVSDAHRAGEKLKTYGITQLLSSPLNRARQTGDIIGSHTGLPNQIQADLQEVSATEDFIGYARALSENGRLWVKNERHVAGRSNQLYWEIASGIESGKALRARAVKAIDTILNKYPGQKIAVVSHYAFINAYISELLGVAGDAFFFIGSTGISVVRAYKEYRAIISLNDTSHTQS